jgi:chromosome segregation ATPase
MGRLNSKSENDQVHNDSDELRAKLETENKYFREELNLLQSRLAEVELEKNELKANLNHAEQSLSEVCRSDGRADFVLQSEITTLKSEMYGHTVIMLLFQTKRF